MIDTIVFDIGNVLVDFCWEEGFKELGFEGEVFEKVANATVRDKAWDLHDKGEYTSDVILDMFIKNAPPMEKEIRLMYDNFDVLIKGRDYAKDWIHRLKKKGYKVYILSNYSEKGYLELKDTVLDFLGEADGYILSYAVKMIKPEPQIYKLLFEKFSIDPATSVFIDDREENLEAGRAFGMRGIRFDTKEQVISDLKKIGVEF